MNRYELNFFKPKKSGKGAGVIFEYNHDRRSIFATMMHQVSSESDRKFDSQNKIVAKLGLSDVGAILSVLRGDAESIGPDGKGIYHQFDSNNSVVTFKKFNADNFDGYSFGLSVTRNNNKSQCIIGLSMPEARLLEIFLYQSTYKMMEKVPFNRETEVDTVETEAEEIPI